MHNGVQAPESLTKLQDTLQDSLTKLWFDNFTSHRWS
jgi:hypothetical protein